MAINGKQFAKKFMGRVVLAHAEQRHVGWRFDRRIPLVGWCVGYKYLRRGSPDSDNQWRNSGPGVPVALVCEWPGRRPVCVPMDAFEVAPDGTMPTAPGWPKEARDMEREYAAEKKRDARGRWQKDMS